ncbi:MAG: hypothetical protein IT371_26020 [Deltaproteobacteria bacterium]|nr:hypothetical protein [Deltaproteobacteria bacterium]
MRRRKASVARLAPTLRIAFAVALGGLAGCEGTPEPGELERRAQSPYPPPPAPLCAYPELAFCDGQSYKSLAGYTLNPWIPRPADELRPYRVDDGLDPALYLDAVNQFGVEAACRPGRYLRRGMQTFCNIFAWDVSRAVGAELPHWVYKRTRSDANLPVPPDADLSASLKVGEEVSANRLFGWLLAHEGDDRYHRWRRVATLKLQAKDQALRSALLASDAAAAKLVLENLERWTEQSDAEVAQELADLGFPVTAIWLNDLDCAGYEEGSGHVAPVLPRPAETIYDPDLGPHVAQAGIFNLGVCDAREGGRGTVAHGFFGLLPGSTPKGYLAGLDRAKILGSVVYYVYLGETVRKLLGPENAPWSCPVLVPAKTLRRLKAE